MYKHIRSVDQSFYDLHLVLSDKDVFALYCDLETTSLDPRNGRILTLQVYDGNDIYIYDFTKLHIDCLKNLIGLFKSINVPTVWHNAKFDIKFIYHFTGIWLTNVIDTMNTEVLLNAGNGKSLYSLEELAIKYAKVELNKKLREEFFSGDITELSDQQLNYAAMDVKVLQPIHTNQLDRIYQAKENDVHSLEMKILPVVANMEYTGILLDVDSWKALEQREIKRTDELQKLLIDKIKSGINYESFDNALKLADALHIPTRTNKSKNELEKITDVSMVKSWVGEKLNLRSSKQLLALLNLFGIECTSTDSKELIKFEKHDIIKTILEFRESGKKISTYGSNFLKLINPNSGRIHTEYFNMGADTGRFSSNSPNLQNIPRDKEYRGCFIPSTGYKFLTADYSQQEFRLVGAISGEKVIIDAYKEDFDMHAATASVILDKDITKISKEERNFGKTINFAVIYGSTEYGLKRNLQVSLDTAKDFIERFYSGYPRLAIFKHAAEEKILELGFSSTLLGRRRYNPEKPIFMDSFEYMRFISRVKREGFNHIIQGGAADITKLAMYNIWINNPFGDKLRMLLQVHDEIDMEVHESVLYDAKKFIEEQMLIAEQPFLGEIPAKVDVNVGECWSK